MAQPRQRTLRCAIYTRKSSEEGLEQSFNSLHAQREACEAFIASQKHEGWNVVPTAYDDGGLSGGSMQRPALQLLLDDVQAGRVNVVVVYKVDRLTRSLYDFSKLTELFDRHGTSFVSVTQQFNTSTSMGRLTLNVLLSFAQFEREVAGERIRDKIALSKRRGMWMGGLPPLGYDGIDGKLVVSPEEADRVRQIFRRYLDVGSVHALKRLLDADGIVSKRRVFKDGKVVGGTFLSRGAIYQILRNRLYRGEIEHRGAIHAGLHDPIVDETTWSAVQVKLSCNRQQRNGRRGPGSARVLLSGLVFDETGNRMTPTQATKNGRRYRYYVSAPLVRGGKDGIRIPAPDLEKLMVSRIAERLRDQAWASQHSSWSSGRSVPHLHRALGQLAERLHATPLPDAQIRSLIARITCSAQRLTIWLNRDRLSEALSEIDPRAKLRDGEELIEIATAVRTIKSGKELRMVIGEVAAEPSPNHELIGLVADAHRWFESLRSGSTQTIAEIAKREGQQVSHVSRTIGLAFLAPDIVALILEGRQPATLTPARLKRRRQLPMNWEQQRALLLT